MNTPLPLPLLGRHRLVHCMLIYPLFEVTGYNIAKILGDTTRNMIKFMQNMLIYWEITAISDPSTGFLTLSQVDGLSQYLVSLVDSDQIGRSHHPSF